jgi:peptidylprolyl isomerase
VNRSTLLAVMGLAVLAAPAMAAHKPKKAGAVPPPAASDFRTLDPQNVLVIDTTKGRIYVELIPEIAPESVARIKELAREHFYDGLIFHRVVDDFMAQGGDPKGDGTGGSTKPNVPAEFTFRRGPDTPFVSVSQVGGLEDGLLKSMPVRSQNSGLMIMTADGKVQAWGVWCPGVAGMARGGDTNSANSQFFLMRQFNEGLEHNYTPWGRVVYGENVVRELKKGEPVVDPDKMTSVRILADLPDGSRPTVQVLNTASPAFKALAANSVSVCDIDLPSKVTP